MTRSEVITQAKEYHDARIAAVDIPSHALQDGYSDKDAMRIAARCHALEGYRTALSI